MQCLQIRLGGSADTLRKVERIEVLALFCNEKFCISVVNNKEQTYSF